MFQRIWEKYFLKEIALTFIAFIAGFYFLYMLVDFSTRYSAYKSLGLSYGSIAIYYWFIFILRVEILVPFAFSIALVRCLCSLNVHNELIALMGSGTPLKRLLRPFLLFSLLLTLALFINTEYLYPRASSYLKTVESLKVKSKNEGKNHLSSVSLPDGSVLFYQNYSFKDKAFQDVFWIRSADEMIHAKLVYPHEKPPLAVAVDLLQRNQKNELIPVSSFDQLELTSLSINPDRLKELLYVPNELPLSELWGRLGKSSAPARNGSKEKTVFYKKLLLPWLSVLVFLGVAPFCVRFTRHLPVFFVYLGSMFSLIAFYLAFNAAIVLGENQVIPPFFALVAPFLGLSALFIWKYSRI